MSIHTAPNVAVACGGTGGHLFPGLAVAEQLLQRCCAVSLLISPKEVDQQAVKSLAGMQIVTLPAVGLVRGRTLAFVRGFVRSYRLVRRQFRQLPPEAVLAMGGFTSAPPVLAGRRCGARTFLHESNTIPGRANRWLSRVVDEVFVGFPQAAERLHSHRVFASGTPVRSQFHPRDPVVCRVALNLDPARPVLLVMGGSQGAGGINELILKSLAPLAQACPGLQLLHLAGPDDADRIRTGCGSLNIKNIVYTFFSEMELALGAATAAVSRAGASSLAELAAMRIPSVLIPYPSATDNHQFHNARALEESGAARLLEQRAATPEALVRLVRELIENTAAREAMQAALARWHAPRAAEQVAEQILHTIASNAERRARENHSGATACGQPGSRPGSAERYHLSVV